MPKFPTNFPVALQRAPYDTTATPFLRLPQDVLRMFLQTLVAVHVHPDPYVPWEGHNDLVNMMRTCKAMRTFMLETPVLWRYITVKNITPEFIPRIQTQISELTRDAKLFVALQFRKQNLGEEESHIPVHLLKKFLDILSPHLHRVQSFLAVGLTAGQLAAVAPLFEGADDVEATSPCPETLLLGSVEESESFMRNGENIRIYSRVFSSLGALIERVDTRCLLAASYQRSLTQLSFTFLELNADALGKLYEALRECPNLEQLRLQEYDQWDQEINPLADNRGDLSIGSVELPRLSQLTLIDIRPLSVTHILATIAYPETATLNVWWDDFDLDGYHWMPTTSPSLQKRLNNVSRMELDIVRIGAIGDGLMVEWTGYTKDAVEPSVNFRSIRDFTLINFPNVTTLTINLTVKNTRAGNLNMQILEEEDWETVLESFPKLSGLTILIPAENHVEIVKEINGVLGDSESVIPHPPSTIHFIPLNVSREPSPMLEDSD
ncbi:hypothetical protein PHLCEN_2v4435 [Hermanssonia centrifuga]|uniref:F-box domain-containing protein n=1 Tax=Hermanssonia centrifuga TaxID=98765 RepID=A0A2R6PNK9_9APHY|nr:hypothetical protein PHLCEN_2v4435 [Hermanssonia centrifuga]